MPKAIETNRRQALRQTGYAQYLRTGRVSLEIRAALGEDIAGGIWYKFNPYHDPDNGQFTFAPGGSGPTIRDASLPARVPATRSAPRPAPKAQTAATKPASLSPKGRALITGTEKFRPAIYHPTSGSGVTIGYGYDLGSRKPDAVVRDLMDVGMSKTDAEIIAKGVGLRGKAATEFASNSKNVAIRLTEQQASRLFEKDVKIYEDVVRKYVNAPINQNQFDAITSLAYTLG
jgi:GH24 family phage-related lysozyme (muramidase)